LAEKNPPAKPEPAPAGTQQQSEIVINDKSAHLAYSNFARVTATPEEVIIDFALNPNPFMQGKQELTVAHRLILNCYTAKRLMMALTQTLERHEQTYGAVELNLNRRLQAGALQQQARPEK
jgi:hypothetical protein